MPVVACGLGADPARAAAAIRAGAREFIPLPPRPDLIAAVLTAAADDRRALIAEDPATKRVIALADQVAASDASILITGESGVGKEVVARRLHSRSRRADRPFVSVNCAAIPEALLESELFGHEKGAFTGAAGRRIGKFEQADGGVLLLDEISELEARLQAKLLRALQEREIDRVGGGAPVRVDIRVIATTNRDLGRATREGAFREDLYYRLNVVNLRVPPLRERPGDILPLAGHFARKHAQSNGLAVRPLSAGACERLMSHAWPGNVRELENAIHRAVLLATGPTIGEADVRLPDGGPLPASPEVDADAGVETSFGAAGGRALVGQTVAAVEQQLIMGTLEHCLGNRTHAAVILGISIRTLRNKLKEYAAAGARAPAPQRGAAHA